MNIIKMEVLEYHTVSNLHDILYWNLYLIIPLQQWKHKSDATDREERLTYLVLVSKTSKVCESCTV